MNFQQLKVRCCDVFVFVVVWVDSIQYWVLSKSDIESNRYYSDKQHRGNTGEGQLHVNSQNIHEFDQYLSNPEDIKSNIIRKS